MKKKTPILIVIAIIIAALLFFVSRTGYGTVALKRLTTFNHFIIDGEKNWLFYRGDMDYVLLPWAEATKNLVAIDSIAKQNKATLIIIPVPNKIDLYPEYFDKKTSSFPYLKNKSARLMSHLKQNDVAILDLYDAYKNVTEQKPTYDSDEAHVTSYGIKIAVEETVKKFFPQYFSGEPACIGTRRISYVGNLAEKKSAHPAERLMDIYYNTCPKESSTAMADTILIVGDSYCNYLEEYRGSYRDLLESYLTNHFLFQTYYKVGAGFSLSGKIIELLKKKPEHKTIIWLFTAREFYKPLRMK